MIIITILIFIIVLGLLVFVHEAGHFFAAKQTGMKVDEFGFGFPPRLIGFHKVNGSWKVIFGNKRIENPPKTIYSINAIPLGGFVKIVGENNDAPDDPRSFTNKPFWPRFRTLVAGVVMNVILAAALLSIGYIYGLPVVVDDPSGLPANARLEQQQPAIVDVVPNSPADKAGLKPSDLIVSIDGQPLATVLDTQAYVQQHKGQTLHFVVKRINEIKTAEVASLANPPANSGPTGIALAEYGHLRYPWYVAIGKGAQTTIYQAEAIVSGLYHLIVHGQGLKDIGGPFRIAQLTGQVAQLGFIPLIQFTAFLSLNLAILNILPFPALDGGRVLFLLIETIRGKRNNQNIEQIANTAGFLFLLLIMALVTAHDILNSGIIHKIIG